MHLISGDTKGITTINNPFFKQWTESVVDYENETLVTGISDKISAPNGQLEISTIDFKYGIKFNCNKKYRFQY